MKIYNVGKYENIQLREHESTKLYKYGNIQMCT